MKIEYIDSIKAEISALKSLAECGEKKTEEVTDTEEEKKEDTPPTSTDEVTDGDENENVEEEKSAPAEDEKEEEKSPAQELNARLSNLENMVAKLQQALRNPSYAYASMKATKINAQDASAVAVMTAEQANKEYAKLTDAKARAEFRRAHKSELGL